MPKDSNTFHFRAYHSSPLAKPSLKKHLANTLYTQLRIILQVPRRGTHQDEEGRTCSQARARRYQLFGSTSRGLSALPRGWSLQVLWKYTRLPLTGNWGVFPLIWWFKGSYRKGWISHRWNPNHWSNWTLLHGRKMVQDHHTKRCRIQVIHKVWT